MEESLDPHKNKEEIDSTERRRREMGAEQLLGVWRGNAFDQIEEYKKSLESNLQEIEKKTKENVRNRKKLTRNLPRGSISCDWRTRS